jgi:WD40 repeat protein
MKRPALAARLSRALVGCYPPRWQQRYREEILDVLDQHQASARTVLSLGGGALATHLDPDYRLEYPVSSMRLRLVIKVCSRIILVAAAGAGLLAGLYFFARVIGLPDFSWQPNPTSGASALAVTPDQRLLATEVGGEPTSALVTLWALGPAGLRRLSAFEGGVTVAIAPDGRLVATSSFHGQAALWNVARPRHPALLSVLSAGSSSALWGEAFSPDSKLLAAAYGGGAALWDVTRPARPRLLTVLNAHVGQVTSSDIAFSPDGHLLALASGNGQVTIWNVARPARGRAVATMSGPRRAGWFTALAFAPGGRLLAGVTTSGTVLVYHLGDPARPVLAAIRRSLVTRALYPDGAGATAAAPTGCPGCLLPGYALRFAPGGRALTVVMDRGISNFYSRDTVLTWPVTASGALGHDVEATRDTWDGLPALAPDGRTVIDGQIFGGTKVRLWELPATADRAAS